MQIGALAGTPAERRAVGQVSWLCAASVALYLATWYIERAIYRNGIEHWTSVLDPGHAPSVRLLMVQVLAYVIVTLLIFGCYLRTLSLCRSGRLATPATRLLTFGTPALISILLLLSAPRLSQDVYSYLAHGYLGVLPGDNPLLQGAEAVRTSTLGVHIDAFGWHASPGITPYGILWTRIEVAIAHLCGYNVWLGIELFKCIAIAANLATAGLIWAVLGRLRPTWQQYGTLAYLWNPLPLVEFSAEGHNDALMIFFTVAALLAALTARPLRSFLWQGLGILSKYVSLLFVPSQLVYLWRQRARSRRLFIALLLAASVLLACAIALYFPFWVGPESFTGLLNRGVPNGLASLFGALGVVLRRTPLQPVSDPLRLAVLTVPTVVFILWQSLKVRSPRQLARVWMWSVLAFLLVASPDYWPWYACMSLALICIADARRMLWLVVLLSLTGRLMAPAELIHDHGYLGLKASKALITGFGSLLPLLCLAAWQTRRWWSSQRWRAARRAGQGASVAPAAVLSRR